MPTIESLSTLSLAAADYVRSTDRSVTYYWQDSAAAPDRAGTRPAAKLWIRHEAKVGYRAELSLTRIKLKGNGIRESFDLRYGPRVSEELLASIAPRFSRTRFHVFADTALRLVRELGQLITDQS